MLALSFGVFAQPPYNPQDQREERKLPSGKSQSEEILKADHEANLKDLEEMRRLLTTVEDDLRKSTRHVLSVTSLRNLEEIEKLSRRVRGRMRRF